MSIKIEKVIKLNELVNVFFRSKHTVVLEPKLEKKYGLFTAICMVVGIVIGSGVLFKAQNILI